MRHDVAFVLYSLNMLVFLGITVGTISYIPYFRDIFKGRTKPHAFSWLVWAALSGIIFFAQIAEGGGIGSLITGFTASMCLVIGLLAIKYGDWDIKIIDWLSLGGAIIAMISWLITTKPLAAVFLVVITEVLGFIPTFRKTFYKPKEETLITFLLSAVKHNFTLAALENFNLTTALQPIFLILANVLFVIMIIWRRKSPDIKVGD